MKATKRGTTIFAAGWVNHRVECSWCGLVIRKGKEPTSHGICDDCRKEMD